MFQNRNRSTHMEDRIFRKQKNPKSMTLYKHMISYSNHLYLKRHLCVVQKPILSKEADVVVALNKSDVCADIKLVLVLARHLKKDFLLS